MPDAHRYRIPDICLECDVDSDTDAEFDPIHGFCAFSLEGQQQDDGGRRRTGGFCRRNNNGASELSFRFYVNSVTDKFVSLDDFQWENRTPFQNEAFGGGLLGYVCHSPDESFIGDLENKIGISWVRSFSRSCG